MFRSVQEKTIRKGVVRTFVPDMGDWEVIAEGGLDILGSINYESLIALTVCSAQLGSESSSSSSK